MSGPGLLSDVLAWTIVGAFGLGGLLWNRRRGVARPLIAATWGLFAVFWLQLAPHFALVKKSFIEGGLALLTAPLCLYAGYVFYRGRNSLVDISRAVAWMGIAYLPFETIPAFSVGGVDVPAPKQVLVRAVTRQTLWAMNLVGSDPDVVVGPDLGYLNTFRFVTAGGHPIEFSIVLACTGLGSIAVFAGLVAAAKAPLGRKLRALAVVVPVIYVLNIVRTTFIGVVFGKQYMQWYPETVVSLFGESDPYLASFYLSDKVVSQSVAVFALIGVAYLVARELPELVPIFEDGLYLLTRTEYDLADTFDLPESERKSRATDGGVKTGGPPEETAGRVADDDRTKR